MLKLKIGIDIDNTLLDFSEAIRRAAFEIYGISISRNASKAASSIRIKELVGNDVWTELQGFVYAEYSQYATVFDGSLKTISNILARGDEVQLISHKSRRPSSGRLVDLHEWAFASLERTGILELFGSRNKRNIANIVLCESLEDKAREIASKGCDLFIDDLYKVLLELPVSMRKIHIFCDGRHLTNPQIECVADWEEVSKSLV